MLPILRTYPRFFLSVCIRFHAQPQSRFVLRLVRVLPSGGGGWMDISAVRRWGGSEVGWGLRLLLVRLCVVGVC